MDWTLLAHRRSRSAYQNLQSATPPYDSDMRLKTLAFMFSSTYLVLLIDVIVIKLVQ